METGQTDQFLKDNGTPTKPSEEAPKLILSVSAISFDFDFVTSDPSKSRADEIRVLFVKNKKPPKKSKEGKPAGYGEPTGQLESKEDMLGALKRETRDETGYPVKKVVGKAFIVYKPWIPNEIHVFVVENFDSPVGVREKEEIDWTVDPWHTLRDIFSLPPAQDKYGGNKNPNGIYYMHLKRLYRAIDSMVFSPEDLINGEAIKQWLKPNRKALMSAMADLERDGLLKEELLPSREPSFEDRVASLEADISLPDLPDY